jgi:hypothetical protein
LAAAKNIIFLRPLYDEDFLNKSQQLTSTSPENVIFSVSHDGQNKEGIHIINTFIPHEVTRQQEKFYDFNSFLLTQIDAS